MNKIKLLRPKLVRNIHHPPFDKDLKYSRSDISVFFTDELLEEAKNIIKDNRKLMVNYWYPDIEWYNGNVKVMSDEKIYDFLDNGKTARDHNKFILSMEKLPDKKGVIVTDKKHIPSLWKENSNVDLYFQDKPNDFTMQQLCMNSKVMVIPLAGDRHILGPIGSTSYMDAIALGMPVVTTDNAAFAPEIKSYDLGVIYYHKADHFAIEMQQAFDAYKRLSANMKAFARTHTQKHYSDKLIKMLLPG